jgi:inosose dehydratase
MAKPIFTPAQAAAVKVAAQPINWINDDFKDLGASTTLAQCLSEMREAGYAGSELGHRFAEDGAAVKKELAQFGLVLAAGWHSTYLAERSLDDEVKAFDAHVKRLKDAGAAVAIVCECTNARHGDGSKPLQHGREGRALDDKAWAQVAAGLDVLAERGEKAGLKVAYHEHMGTPIQDAADVDELMKRTTKLHLLLDTGHLFFAGADPVAVLEKHQARVAHVHLKNVRASVAQKAREMSWSFEKSVREGVFTVPGDVDGAVDYERVLGVLAASNYQGWLVVEAEQDPAKANPLTYAKKARAYLRDVAGV